MRPSKNVDDAPQGQQKKPESSAQEHVAVPQVSQSAPTRDEPGNPAQGVKSLEKSRQISDDESDMSDDGGWSWYPDIKANDQAQWRRMALAKRASLGGTAAGSSAILKGNIDSQLYGNSNKAIDEFDKCRESLVAASAANEILHSTQVSGTISVSVF